MKDTANELIARSGILLSGKRVYAKSLRVWIGEAGVWFGEYNSLPVSERDEMYASGVVDDLIAANMLVVDELMRRGG